MMYLLRVKTQKLAFHSWNTLRSFQQLFPWCHRFVMNFPLGIGFTSQNKGSSSAEDLHLQCKGTRLLPHSRQNLLLFSTRWTVVPSRRAATQPGSNRTPVSCLGTPQAITRKPKTWFHGHTWEPMVSQPSCLWLRLKTEQGTQHPPMTEALSEEAAKIPF